MSLIRVAALAAAITIAIVAMATAPSSGADAQDVAAWDPTGQRPVRCLDVDASAYPIIDGGCLVRAKRERIGITVLTAFGPMRMGRCMTELNLHIGPKGNVWMQGLAFNRPDAFCGDIRPCRRELKDHLPWKGRISRVAGGRYEIAFDMCLDTCVGRFEGEIVFDLLRERSDWRMRAKRSVAGTSGLQLDGSWDLDALNLGPTTERYFDRAGPGAPGFDLR